MPCTKKIIFVSFTATHAAFGALVRGKRVLIIDEVDDTRATLQYAVEELKKTNNPAAVGVLVVHNKLKPKKGTLPDDVTYIAGEHVPNAWNCYPCAHAHRERERERERAAPASHSAGPASHSALNGSPTFERLRCVCVCVCARGVCACVGRWDAPAYGRDINAHEALARECMGERVYGFADMCKAALAGAAVMVVFLVAMKVGITPLHGRAEFN